MVSAPVDISTEQDALVRAREAADVKLHKLSNLTIIGADPISEDFIAASVRGAMEQLQQQLTVFGRVDDEQPWRVGLFGIDRDGEQLVVDWRAPFARGFYQACCDDPMGLVRRVSYVGCIDDLMIEEFDTGLISGSSPLLAELSKSKGPHMRAAVATLQSEQDLLVRKDPGDTLVLRGGPGTGKTVVGLHRAAWLVYNDRRITSDRLLIVGPSDRFLKFVSTVLPTLGESKIVQTTLERHLGPSTEIGSDPQWITLLDEFERVLIQPDDIRVRGITVSADELSSMISHLSTRKLPWGARRKIFIDKLAAQLEVPRRELDNAVRKIFPTMAPAAAWTRLRSPQLLASLGADEPFIRAFRTIHDDGPLRDELGARFSANTPRYAHVIVDEAQDLSLLQLRAMQRRATGLTLVGDDAQRSAVNSIGLRRCAELLGTPLEHMRTAYRMSAEIAQWLNEHAERFNIDAVELVGVRPTGIAVSAASDAHAAASGLEQRWDNVAVIASDVWDHKGVEYDAVVVDATTLTPEEIYLAASRAAHELVIVHAS